jgi:hypothetical protein
MRCFTILWVLALILFLVASEGGQRMCPRGWWVDQDQPVMVPCKDLGR